MTEVVPAARDLLAALAAPANPPTKAVLTGGIGTGKSSTLTAIRNLLRTNQIAASVVDDAEQLGDAELADLTRLAHDPDAVLIIACQPCEQRPALRALIAAIEQQNPRISLGPFTRMEVARYFDNHDPDELSTLLAATAGLPLLLTAVRGVPLSATSRTAFLTLLERLRRIDAAVLDVMLILSLTPGLGPSDVAAALRLGGDTAADLVDRSYATGLLQPGLGSRFGATVHRAVAQILGAARHHEIESALLASQSEISTLSIDLALQLSEHGMRDAALAAVLQDAGSKVGQQSSDAVRLYRAALAAAVEPSPALTLEYAEALYRAGECTEATSRAESLLSSDSAAVRAAAVQLAAAIAAHDGNATSGAELFSWLGSTADAASSGIPSSGAAAALLCTVTGDAVAARTSLGTELTGPPTTSSRVVRSVAEGLLLTLDAPYATAMARLGQAVTGTATTPVFPDSPSAVVALAALHSGDADRARSVLTRTLRANDPDPVFGHRHRLLYAWLKMQDGQLQSAAADAAQVPESGLHARDALWRSALLTGLARRNGDSGALQHHWHASIEILTDYSIDLLSLLPVGELWVAAARIQREDRLAHPLEQAFGLLGRLGDPPSWSLPLHWAGVHAAILANRPDAMAPHAEVIARLAEPVAAGHRHDTEVIARLAEPAGSNFARVLANAGRAWLRVLANQVDFDDVAAAARGLAQYGLTWDATRLAGQAALQTPDPRISGGMLQVARDLKLSPGPDGPAAPPAPAGEAQQPTPAGPPATNRTTLSEREREVAELLLLGMPYRDIGAQLFISAKTVEHHVARIRRRLGAQSRSEMLSLLRAMLGSST